VYVHAPREIIYKIAKHNFRQADALSYTRDGNLQTVVD